jgi:predicted nucleic acid-binding protein
VNAAGEVVLYPPRRRGGSKAQVLPDFFIGAHAAVEGWPLLTRDPSRFRTWFPSLVVLAP